MWPVPVTDNDFKSISSKLRSGELMPLFNREVSEPELFRQLKVDDEKLHRFGYSLEKRADGRCEFLSEENRCLLHQHFGEEAKPAMCRLFPYTFTDTPSGVFASVSFASSGALLNFGRPLSEQSDVLDRQFSLFQNLFPSLKLDWSQIQLSDGESLSWEKYLGIESKILPAIKSLIDGESNQKRVDIELLSLAAIARSELPKSTDLDKIPEISARPKTVDQLLVKEMISFYFPEDVFSSSQSDLDVRGLARHLIQPPAKVEIEIVLAQKRGVQKIGFDKLYNLRLGKLPDDIENLLARYVYCRIFSKLFFGPGFGYLSLLAGLHHLVVLVSLVRMRLKIDKLLFDEEPRFERAAELVRVMERRLTVANLSRESAALLEVLLAGAQRPERIASLTA